MKSPWLEKLASEGVIRPEVKEAILSDCMSLVLEAGNLPKTASEVRGLTESVSLEKAASIYADAVILTSTALHGFEKQALSPQLLQRAADEAVRQAKGIAGAGQVNKYRQAEVFRSGVVDKLVSVSTPEQRIGDLKNTVKNLQRKVTELGRKNLEYEKNISKLNQKKPIDFSTAKTVLRNAAVLGSVGLAGGAGVGAAKYLMSLKEKKDVEKKLRSSWDEVLRASDPQYEQIHAQKDRAREAFNMLAHFAPHVAMQPIAAKGFVNKILGFEGQVTAEDVKHLTEIEKNIAQARGESPFASGFQSGSEALGLRKAVDLSFSEATQI